MNGGVTATLLIDRIAAIPSTAGNCPSAVITKEENAKNTPPTIPHPSAVMPINPARTPSLIRFLQ
jgi:hypothetical protein